MQILFMGTPEFAVFSLQAILESDNQIVGVVTQPDRPRGRGKKIAPSPVKKMAIIHKLPLMQPEKVTEESFINQLKALLPAVIVVVAYGQILPRAILNIPRFGCINLHASLLPKYRGPSPINWAIIRGEKVTGVTTIQMNEEMDAGDILLQREVLIEKGESAFELYHRLAKEGAELLLETLSKLKEGNLNPISQDSTGASYAPPLKKRDGLINWSRSGEEISNLIQGLSPSPGAYTHIEDKRLKVYGCLLVNKKEVRREPGEICKIDKIGVKVACGSGYLYLKEAQLENRERMPIEEFLLGTKIKVGTILK